VRAGVNYVLDRFWTTDKLSCGCLAVPLRAEVCRIDDT